MAYDSFSAEQLELIDLIRNELADYVDGAPAEMWQDISVRQQHFDYTADQIEHLARAADMVGLSGFSLSCVTIAEVFKELAQTAAQLSVEQQQLIDRWPVEYLAYLQALLAHGFSAGASQKLVSYLGLPSWPKPLSRERLALLHDAFARSEVIVDENPAALYPAEVGSAEASLVIPDDVRPELLEGLKLELPQQAETFSASIEHYIHTQDASYLLTAQRIAHTIKGAGNVVGVAGVANLMHYCEDLLETHQKGVDVGGDGFADLLQEAADCLANTSDYLLGYAPAPDNLADILTGLLKALHGDAAVSGPSSNASHGEKSVPDDMPEAKVLAAKLPAGTDCPSSDPVTAADKPDLSALNAEEASRGSEGLIEPEAGEQDAEFEASLFDSSSDLLADPNPDIAISTLSTLASNDESEESAVLPILQDDIELEGLSEVDELALFDDEALLEIDQLLADVGQTGADNGVADLTALDTQTSADLPGTAPEVVRHESAEAFVPVITAEESISEHPRNTSASLTLQSSGHSDAGQDSQSPFSLTISDDVASDLLRVAGEMQISNTQVLSRVEGVKDVVSSASRFHQQLLELAEDLDKRLARQSAAAIAASSGDNSEMDPLELERYNELHSFASRLQEVTKDADEAVKDAEHSLLELKNIVTDQRQLGFEMQDQVLGIRMLPASVLSSRFARAVRQAARLTHKAAAFEVEGDDVMVDSRVIHAIADPLMHLLRNAVDHGLEKSAAEREAINKPAEGKITLRFDRIGESVRIRVMDDGSGLDYAAIKRTALERGLLEESDEPTNNELERIILMPGFSTRNQVTQTSGRGIGLDVVNDQVRQLKGTLAIRSDLDLGTTVELLVPMSVLSAHLLMTRVGEDTLGIVSRGLQQIVYLLPSDIERDDGAYYYQMGDDAIPVKFLAQLLAEGRQDILPSIEECNVLLITEDAFGQRIGIAADEIVASEEHVVKPLGRFSYKPVGVTGAAILGSGDIAPVVDVHELPGLRLSEQERERWLSGASLAERGDAHVVADKPVALVVDDSLSARRAMAQFMADAGYDVLSARDGFDAISAMENKTPEIALIDLEMPRMNGLELASHMRGQERLANVPVVMITSRTTARHKLLAQNAGVDLYLNKPWSDDELSSALEQLLHGVSAANM